MRFNWTEPPEFLYPPPTLKTAPSGASWYETHNGKKAVRASKVVQGSPFDPVAWFEMCGGQSDGQLVSNIINNLGTLTHSRIEKYLRNEQAPKWNLQPVNAYFGGIMPLLDNIDNITVCEQPLYSESLNIAGTTDCIGDYNGVRSIIDFKTSTKPKKESEILHYFLQCTLYARMWQEMTGEKIGNIAILMTVNGGQYKSFVKRTADYEFQLDAAIQKFEGLA